MADMLTLSIAAFAALHQDREASDVGGAQNALRMAG
jgi:hypothetical protein